MVMKKVIYGSPGCGKTTRLIGIVKEALESGTPISKIGYMSHTKKGAMEALSRTVESLNVDVEQARWFSTVHAACYRLNGVQQVQVVSKRDYTEFAKWAGADIKTVSSDTEEALQNAEDDDTGGASLRIGAVARNSCIDLYDVWEEYQSVSWDLCEYVNKAWHEWKVANGKLDFTDMLEQVSVSPHLDLLIIDEAQDLPKLQWNAVEVIGGNAHTIIAAGDDDQAIFGFTGANHNDLVSFSDNTEVLGHSYRLNTTVFNYANDIIRRIKHRKEKTWEPHSSGGFVDYVDIDDLPLSEGNWFLIARNNYLLGKYKVNLIEQGYLYEDKFGMSVPKDLVDAVRTHVVLKKGEPVKSCAVSDMLQYMTVNTQYKRGARKRLDDENFLIKSSQLVNDYGISSAVFEEDWYTAFTRAPANDISYLRRCLSNNEKIGKPRIFVGTVHAVKGGEADNVAMMLDTSKRCDDAMNGTVNDSDNEWRCLYVAVTRTKKNLYLIDQVGRYGYEI